MTLKTNARIAGFTFLFYIAVGVQHAANPGIAVLLTLLQSFSALVLAVTLYGITSGEDQDIAMLALTCRVVEGVLGALSKPGSSPLMGATFFAVGSVLFSWLLLRGRLIPPAMAWLGVFASLLLMVGLPLQLAGVVSGKVTLFMWLPMLAFEVPLGFWLLIKGVAGSSQRPIGQSPQMP